jgi:hypothetical protein
VPAASPRGRRSNRSAQAPARASCMDEAKSLTFKEAATSYIASHRGGLAQRQVCGTVGEYSVEAPRMRIMRICFDAPGAGSHMSSSQQSAARPQLAQPPGGRGLGRPMPTPRKTFCNFRAQTFSNSRITGMVGRHVNRGGRNSRHDGRRDTSLAGRHIVTGRRP